MAHKFERDLAIFADGLSKQFGDRSAVSGVSLCIPAGSVFALLGPNGAGKSVTVRMLTTLLRPDSGSASIFGDDLLTNPGAVRRRIALTGQFASIDEDMTGRDNLELIARLFGLAPRSARHRADELLEVFGLTDAGAKAARVYSGGMRRRLDIAASLVRRPQILFLDEPTTGLDPASRTQVWNTVRGLADEGMTVLLTTQYLEEADRLAGRIAVMDRGTIIAEGTSSELKARVGEGTFSLQLADDRHGTAALAAVEGLVRSPRHEGRRVSFQLATSTRASAVLAALDAASIPLHEFAYAHPSLDEVFLALTGDAAEHLSARAEHPQ